MPTQLIDEGSFTKATRTAIDLGMRTQQNNGYIYIALETGANNAIAGALLDWNGAVVPLVAGLYVCVLLAHTLQAGANTFALNGGAAKNIKSHLNPANNIATAYAVGAIVDLIYDGTQWQDMAQ